MTRPAQVMDLWSDYEPAAVIGAAFECDLFRPLLPGRALEPAAIAAPLARPLRLVQELLDALVQLDALRTRQGRYRLAAPWAQWLQPDYDALRSRALGRLRPMRRWLALAGTDAHASAPDQEAAMFRTGEGLERYLRGVRAFNEPTVQAVAAALRGWLAGFAAPRVADLGGGHAAFVLALARQHPGLAGDVVDLPATIEVSQRMNRDEPLLPRLRFVPGDARQWSGPPAAYDLVMVNDLLHSFDAAGKQQVLAQARRALRPGGRLLVSKFTRPRGGPRRDNALFSLKLYVNTDFSGYLEDDEDVAEMARALGLAPCGGFAVDNKSCLLFAAAPAPAPRVMAPVTARAPADPALNEAV